MKLLSLIAISLLCACAGVPSNDTVIQNANSSAAPMPLPAAQDGVWTVKDFKFHTGEVLPELKLAYTTLGNKSGEAILVLHGTTGNGRGMLSHTFGGELFGPGQPLDATKYWLILPDSIGHGRSSKPSDGLRAKFPRYNYEDMVDAQYRLLTEHLGVKKLRLVIGNSMGGMETWIWGYRYPKMMDALVPMASLPTAMASRNWMMRRLIIDSIKNDPAYQGGNYTTQPKSAQTASVFYGLATNGGNLALQKAAPTGEAADKLLNQRLAAPFPADANDTLYHWDSSRDFNPTPHLEKIEAKLLAINSMDDERNPPETHILQNEIKRVKNGQYYLVPASSDTAGHGTTGQARFWKQQFAAWFAPLK